MEGHVFSRDRLFHFSCHHDEEEEGENFSCLELNPFTSIIALLDIIEGHSWKPPKSMEMNNNQTRRQEHDNMKKTKRQQASEKLKQMHPDLMRQPTNQIKSNVTNQKGGKGR